MAKKTIETIVKKQLKKYRTEVIMFWFLSIVGAILILTGIGIYFYVGKLAIAQYLPVVPIHNFIVSEIEMLYAFSEVLGIVFSLVGIVSIVFALDRLALRKAAHRMAVYISKIESSPVDFK